MWRKEGRNAVIDAQVPDGYYYSLQACHQPPTGLFLTVFRIRIPWFSIRYFRLNTNQSPDPGVWWPKIGKIYCWKKMLHFFKNFNLLILRPPKRTSELQERLLALKREHLALKTMKCLHFFIFLWVIYALGSDPNPDPLTWIRIQPGFGYETLVSKLFLTHTNTKDSTFDWEKASIVLPGAHEQLKNKGWDWARWHNLLKIKHTGGATVPLKVRPTKHRRSNCPFKDASYHTTRQRVWPTC